jgi:hypothetical protein
MNTYRTFIILLTIAGILIISSTVLGQSSARSVAMGGAHIGLASGIDAAKFNPANLGLSNHRNTDLEFLGLSANVSNNSFTLSDYNKYTGAYLTSKDKNDILDKVPEEGLKVSADIEANALSLASGPFALAVTAYGIAEINLNKDILDLVLNGNSFADTIDVNGSYSHALSYATAGLSWGTSIYSKGSRQLAIGATAKYVRGVAIEEVTDLRGMAATFETGFQGNGELKARTAQGGTGYAVDLGTSLKINNGYTVAACIENFVSSIKWDQKTKEYGYLFNFDTMTFDNSGDDYVVSDDYTKDIPTFTTSLPSTLTVGVANTSGSLVWAADWQQRFRNTEGSSTKPRFSVGFEYKGLKVIPIRAGYSTGGNRNSGFSFGSGINLVGYYLDLAAVTGSSFSGYSTKGVNIAVSTGLHF